VTDPAIIQDKFCEFIQDMSCNHLGISEFLSCSGLKTSLPYLTLSAGSDPRQTSRSITSLKLRQTSRGEANGCHSAYPI